MVLQLLGALAKLLKGVFAELMGFGCGRWGSVRYEFGAYIADVMIDFL